MAIDTYVVAIEPKFNVAAFRKIKDQIEGLAKSVKSIPITVKLTNTSFAGIKSKINSEINKGNYQVKIPVVASITGKSFSDLKSQPQGLSLKAFDYPVRFNLRGAKTDLLEQLKGLSFKPISIPARIVIQGGVQGKVPSEIDVNEASADKGKKGGYHGIGSGIVSATKHIGTYGLAFGAYNFIGKNIAAPFLIEKDLYSLLAIEQYKKESLQGIRDVVIDIGRELPITGPDVSAGILRAARDDVSPEKLVGKYEDIHGNVRYDTKKSQIYVASKLAAYAGEQVEDIVILLKLLNEALPNIETQKWGNLLAGAADISSWKFTDMSQYVQSASVGGIKGMNIDPLTFLGVMAWQSKVNKKPGQAADSLRVFDNFTKWAKSDAAGINMDILGLQRYNKEGTQLQNFRNYLFDLNKIYKELNENEGYITRTYNKTTVTGRGKNRVATTERTTEKFSAQEVGKMLYDIVGSDAIKFASSLNNNELQEVIAAFDKLLQGADLDKKLQVVSQSAIYKLQLLLSEIEAAFTEAFDITTIKNIGAVFKDVSLWVKDLANEINKAGGLSGYIKEWKKENADLLSSISAVGSALSILANSIVWFANLFSSKNYKLNNFGNPFPFPMPGLQSTYLPMVSSASEGLKDKLMSNVSKESPLAKINDLGYSLGSKLNAWLFGGSGKTVNNNGDTTININGVTNPEAAGNAVVNRLSRHRDDGFIPSGTAATNGF